MNINKRLLLYALKTCVSIVLLSCSLISYSQSTNLEKKISISVENKTLGEVLNEISTKGQINFSFINNEIPVSRKVSLKANDKSIKNILDDLLKGIDLDYEIVENHLIIKPSKQQNSIQSPPQDKKQGYTLSGYLRDKQNGENMIGAVVSIKDLKIGTATNAYGFFSLTVPKGNYNLDISYVGYKASSIPINLQQNTQLNLDMEGEVTQIQEILVVGNKEETEAETNHLTELILKPLTLSKMPTLLGEVDFIKSLQAVPGIKPYGDGSVSFYVRGGDKDQNLLLIDEAPIYNPAHLLGFFSTFIPEAIRDIKIYKNDVPVNYSDRLSSVIDLRTKDGNMKKFEVNGNIGLISSKISLEGPIVKDRCSYFISLRRSELEIYFPLLFKKTTSEMSLYFYDFNAKLNVKFNDKNRIYFSIYSGQDSYSQVQKDIGNFGISWGNVASTIRWNHLFSDKLFSNTTLYASRYDYYLYPGIAKNGYWNSYLANLNLKNDFTYYYNNRNTLLMGFNITRHDFNPSSLNTKDPNQQAYVPEVPHQQANELAIYASNEQKITEKFTIRYGVRVTSWQNIGPTVVYKFDPITHLLTDTTHPASGAVYNTYANFEPRLSLKYHLNKTSSIKGSIERTVQYIQCLSNSLSPFTSLDIWMPASVNIQPQKANQVNLGYFKKLNSLNLDFSVETYYKKLFNQIDYKDHAAMLLNPLVEGELRFGTAKAYGIEFLVKRTEGKLTGWVGYTYSRVFKTIEGINNGNSYPAFYDRPNDFSIFLNYKSNGRWSFSANWLYSTGSAITTPTSFYYYQGYSVPYYGEKNNDRLPAYHRLDLSATLKLNKNEQRFMHTLTFAIYNVYARQNPVAIDFNKVAVANNKFDIPADLNNQKDIVSTQLSLLGCIPSINYSFKF